MEYYDLEDAVSKLLLEFSNFSWSFELPIYLQLNIDLFIIFVWITMIGEEWIDVTEELLACQPSYMLFM